MTVDAAHASGIAETTPLIFLIAGEPSGDVLGGRLMAALKDIDDVRFAGVGGGRMADEGLSSLFPMSELSIMGLAEVLPHVPRLMWRINQTVAAIRECRPAAVVTIDSPGFNYRVAKRLKGQGIPMIHYVAPTVWAWRPGRARATATLFDHLLALLPFEPPYFDAVGLPCTFVGHPVVESGAEKGNGKAFRERHGIAPDAVSICLLPGSRLGEIKRLLPVFRDTVILLRAVRPSLRISIPTVPALSEAVKAAVQTWEIEPPVVIGENEKYDAFAASNVALAASGTVALELALAKIPTVIAYKINAATAWALRRLIKVRFVNLINIILGREAIPEMLQENCRPDRLADALERLLDDAMARNAQTSASEQALAQLGLEGPSPSHRAAETVMSVVAAQAPGIT